MTLAFIVISLLLLSICSIGWPVQPNGPYGAVRKATSNDVVVRRLGPPLPDQEEDIFQFLWNNFANKPEEQQFSAYTTEHWQSNYHLFAKSLVRKAVAESLDAVALDSCLVRLFDHGKCGASLPVGAYATHKGLESVWILTVKWEATSDEAFDPLVHIRIVAFNSKTFCRVGFATCG